MMTLIEIAETVGTTTNCHMNACPTDPAVEDAVFLMTSPDGYVHPTCLRCAAKLEERGWAARNISRECRLVEGSAKGYLVKV